MTHSQALVDGIAKQLAEHYERGHARIVSRSRRKKVRESKPDTEQCAALARAFLDAVRDDNIVAARMSFHRWSSFDGKSVEIEALTDSAYIEGVFKTNTMSGDVVYANRTALNSPVRFAEFSHEIGDGTAEFPQSLGLAVGFDRANEGGRGHFISIKECPARQQKDNPVHFLVEALDAPMLTVQVVADMAKGLEGFQSK